MKKVTSVILAMMMMFSMTVNVFADSDETLLRDSENKLFTVDEICGKKADSLETLFSLEQVSNKGAEPKLSDLNFIYENGELLLIGNLYYNGKMIKFKSSGKLYKNEKTQRAAIWDNLILGEMSDFNDFHFVQLKFDKEESNVLITLQNKKTKELLEFNLPIEISLFDKLYSMHNNDIKEEELDEKILKLDCRFSNVIDFKRETYSISSSVSGASTSANSISEENIDTLRANYTGWSNLIRDLKVNYSVKLSDYDNINSSFFLGHGYRYDNDMNTVAPYSFVSYSYAEGNGKYKTQFALVDVVKVGDDLGDNRYELGLQVKYNDGMIVRYDEYTDELSVVLFDIGLKYNHFKVGVGKLTNKAVFVSREVHALFEQNGNLIRAAISLFPTLETLTGVFEHLTGFENQEIPSNHNFDSTYDAQVVRYNGSVIRGIMIDSEKKWIKEPGHYINIKGIVEMYKGRNFKWWWAYNYTVNHSF